ncbi:hypothetical protein TNCV_351541 [Trichonephila clavipes]|nr:hypothetical protein TNCV_351541 [Trichonephila clavipes]
MGAVLTQLTEQGEEHPILYLSKKFSEVEKRNCTTEKECASIVFAIKGMKKLVIMALYRSPLTVTLWPSSFLKKYGPMIPPAHKAHQTVSFSGCNGVSTYTCGLASLQMRQFCLLT